MGIDYKIKTVATKEELTTVANELIKEKVDSIILTSSGLLYNNTGLIIDKCTKNGIPIFSVNKNGVPNGAIAAFASDYYVMVDECLIPMVKDVLANGKNPGGLAIRSLENPYIFLNITQAEKLGIEISEEIISRASSKF